MKISGSEALSVDRASAEQSAEWFALLADPTRVRLLHTLSTSRSGSMRIGDLAELLGISQSTCSHHCQVLNMVGFVVVEQVGTPSMVSVHPSAEERALGDECVSTCSFQWL